MPRLKKFSYKRDLQKYRGLIEDTDPESTYFKVSQIPASFSGGKNAILIHGTPLLVPTTKVLVEILDSGGNTIFSHPIKNYEEGLARVESIEVYEDTPPGLATITILGEASSYADGREIPPEWRNKYNVRWQKQINVQPFQINSTKIRLYETPTISASELLVQYRTAFTGSTIYQSGSASLEFSGLPHTSASNVSYTLNNISFPLSRSMEGGMVYSNQQGYTASIISVINSSSAKVSNGLASPPYGFALSDIMAVYDPPNTFLGTALTRSYADIKISKLTTFSGDIARAKIYVKSVDQPDNYQQIEDIILEATPVLVTASLVNTTVSSGNRDLYLGRFEDQSIIDNYWQAGTASITNGYIVDPSVSASYAAERLMDAAKISNIPSLYNTGTEYPRYFFGTKPPISFLGNTEYTLTGNFACVKDISPTAKLAIFLSGSSVPTSNPLGVLLESFQVNSGEAFKKFEDVKINFVIPRSGSAQLNFAIYGGEWHYSDIEIDAATSTGFNPDSARVFAQILDRRYERLKFKTELFDGNNNAVPVLIESDPVFFNGGNYVFKGEDHRIEGEIQIIPSGAAPALTGIKLTTRGFYSGGNGGPPGAFQSGSSIFIGSGSVFTKTTPFIVASNLSGSPEIAIGDKLYGYIDQNSNEFILKILGTILVGSGSNFVDIRSLFPRSPKDAQFARVTAQVGDFYDLRGRYAVSAGQFDDQIARMGNYTRERFPEVWHAPINLSGIDESYDAYETSSYIVATSGTLDLAGPGIGFYNNTTYLNGLMQLTAYTASTPFLVKYSSEAVSSWTGYPSTGSFGTEFAGDDFGITVVQTGSILVSNTINFPIPVPDGRVGNTLYVMVKVTITTVPTT